MSTEANFKKKGMLPLEEGKEINVDADVIEISAEEEAELRRTPVRIPERREVVQEFLMNAATQASYEHPAVNEDAHLIVPHLGIAGVFDGMGAVPAGDYASDAAKLELTAAQINKRTSEAKTTEEHQKSGLIKKVFGSSIETPLEQEEVEAAMDAMLWRMNNEVERLSETTPIVRDKAIEYFNKNLRKNHGEFNEMDEEHKRLLKKILRGIGCTASVMKMWQGKDGTDRVTIGHIGDSRIYRLRAGKLERLTRDDSQINVLVEMDFRDIHGKPINEADVTQELSKEALFDLDTDTYPVLENLLPSLVGIPGKTVTLAQIRHSITQAIGGASQQREDFQGKLEFKPQIRTEKMEDDDIYLDVCDGISDNLTDEEIQKIALANIHHPELIPQKLIEAALARSMDKNHPRSKPDDMTAAIARYKKRNRIIQDKIKK